MVKVVTPLETAVAEQDAAWKKINLVVGSGLKCGADGQHGLRG